MVRRMRTINEVVKYIKREDEETSINRHMIENLILSHKVHYIRTGNVYHVDLDDCLNELKILRKEN